MQNKKRKLISLQMILFELRNTMGNPYVHIFGIGLPVLLVYVISRVLVSEITDVAILSMAITSLFLGIGAIIPLATVLIGYSASRAQELEKGIPQRMELFGIKAKVSVCNKVVSELIFMMIAFVIYFAFGYLFMDIEMPTASGALLYAACILGLSVIMFCMAHSVATIFKKFGITYCITMMLYFAILLFSGMMGVTYDNMSGGMQAIAKLLPTTYINKDFYTVWAGESYNFVPMVQAYLFLAAVAGILWMVALKRTARKLH